jgi:hypothetical protein
MPNVEFSNDECTKTYILSLFGKKVSQDGKVIDEKTTEPLLSVDGREVTLENFGAVEMVNSQPVFILNDIVSIMEFQVKYGQLAA